MDLYNRIDGYANRLGAAWVNVHHASKGDQSGKITTDVGSGAGSQSRAADTHCVLREHEEENVAVMEAVVRSFPPIKPLAIRWTFPTWHLDTAVDPKRIVKKNQSRITSTDDQHKIVQVMMAIAGPATKTHIRDASLGKGPKFDRAWASLLVAKTIIQDGTLTVRGQDREAFVLSTPVVREAKNTDPQTTLPPAGDDASGMPNSTF